MRKRHNELAMGVTVTVIAAGIVIGILYLQQPGILATGERIRLMIDHVESLSRGDEVKYRGVRIGTVQSIDFIKSGLMVNLQIDPGIQIPKDSQFYIESAGILSGASVVIRPGTSSQNLPQNAVVQGKAESGLLTYLQSDSSVQDKVNGVLANAQDFLKQINQFPQAEIGRQVQQILTSLNTTVTGLNETVSHLNGVITEDRQSVNDLLNHVDGLVQDNSAGIGSAVDKLNTDVAAFQNSLSRLDQTLNDARSAIGQIDVLVQSVNSGEGTAGKLLTDNTLYHKLNDTLDSINALAKDIKENPKKYVQVRVF